MSQCTQRGQWAGALQWATVRGWQFVVSQLQSWARDIKDPNWVVSEDKDPSGRRWKCLGSITSILPLFWTEKPQQFERASNESSSCRNSVIQSREESLAETLNILMSDGDLTYRPMMILGRQSLLTNKFADQYEWIRHL